MTKEMIVSSSDHETRVAIIEEDEVAELFIERENQRGVVGNIYKGRVSKVLPGMQAAFVQIGLERDGFLYVSDVVNTWRRSSSSTTRKTSRRDARAAAMRTRRWRSSKRRRGRVECGGALDDAAALEDDLPDGVEDSRRRPSRFCRPHVDGGQAR